MEWPAATETDRQCGMTRLSPHRRFRNADNMEGIPRVFKHRAAPPRGEPLPGTRKMRTPPDEKLLEMIRRAREIEEKPPFAARLMGWLAVAGVLGLWCLCWHISRTPGVGLYSHGGMFTALVILFLGGIHVLAIFSQILSNGRERTGSIALMLLYGGSILLAVVDHITR